MPLAVPGDSAGQAWRPYSLAQTEDFINRLFDRREDQGFAALKAVFDAYARGDVRKFNTEVANYRRYIATHAPDYADVEPSADNFICGRVVSFTRPMIAAWSGIILVTQAVAD